MSLIDTLIGGGAAGLGSMFKDIVGVFKASPEDKLKFQALIEQNQEALAEKQLELKAELEKYTEQEIESSAEIIKTEAGSQSWLPRNVRPLLLLLWGLAISFNVFVPVVARFWIPNLQPIVVDAWVYKLTAIGFTGYVCARSTEKLFDKDQ